MVKLLDFGFGVAPSAKRPPQTCESDSRIEPLTESTAQSAGDTSRQGSQSAKGVNSDLGRLSVEQIRKLPNCDKSWIVRNCCRPDADYKFPSKDEYGKLRSFQHVWLREYSWLSYSQALDGGFCVSCLLFNKRSDTYGQLVKTPLTNFTRAKQTLKEHNSQTYHRSAVEDTAVFMGQMESGHLTVQQQLQSHALQTLERNRKILTSILKCIVFCGKQNIPLRGHRNESASFTDGSLKTAGNPGNFQALLQFRMESGDADLLQHFSSADRNAQYRSPRVQNDLVASCGEWIKEKIVAEVRKAKYFSVCADEAADVANKEQLPLVLRFVDESRTLREEFIEFVLCDHGTSGSAVAEKIIDMVEKLGLDPTFLRGQGYDGAGNMAGRVQGAAAHILKRFPAAHYVHCGSHALNLCIVSACKQQNIRNMYGTLEEVCIFFHYSPKRQQLLEEEIKKLDGVSHTKLVNLCKTRWVARINAFDAFSELFQALFATLQNISSGQGWNTESSRQASALLHAIQQFAFIHAFVVARHGLGYIKGITTSLQSRTCDVVYAYGEVATVIKTVEEVRRNFDTHHKKWFDEAKALCAVVDAADPALPRTCGRQQHRSNISASTPEEYFKISGAIPFMDVLIEQLHQRFSETQRKAIAAMAVVPSALEYATEEQQDDMVKMYGQDMPSSGSFKEELAVWKQKWKDVAPDDLPHTLTDALKHADKLLFPNIHCLIRIMCTLPVTSCECERTISVLRRLKTYMRANIGQERLTGLALLHTKYTMELNLDEIINKFAAQHPRRMLL